MSDRQQIYAIVHHHYEKSRAGLESELQALALRADEIRLRGFGGGRELALAITNIEQGLMWLEKAAQKL